MAGRIMRCPNCGRPGLMLAVKECGGCGESYVTRDLLELNQLEFLAEETAAWEGVEALRLPYVERLEALRAQLLRREAAQAEVVTGAVPAPAAGPAAVGAGALPALAVVEAAPKPVAPVPPKEKVPFDQWLLSERNIKIALYSGAVLLVVAGLIFVSVNWARMSGPAKFAIMVMVTGLMYLGGTLLFRRPALRIGGIALLGIASGFVVADLAILQIYVLGPAGLRDDVMWLIASPLCLVLYLVTAYWTRGDLFTYLGLAAAASAVTAALVVAGAPRLALLPAYALLAYGVLWLARALRNSRVADLAGLPTLITAQGGMAMVSLAAIGFWVSETGCARCVLGNPWLAILALGVGVVFYATTDAVLKWLAARWAAAVLLAVTVGLALVELDASDTVSGLSLMLLALAYLGAGYALERRDGRRRGAWPLYATAYAVALVVTAMAIPSIDALYKLLFADVILLVISAAIYRDYRWIYGAAWLFMLPVYLILYLFVPSSVYQGLLMGLLGLNYAVAGYALGRRRLFLAGPFLAAAAFLSVVAVGLTWGEPVVASLVLGGAAVLYLFAALWLGWTWLLLPALLAVHLVVFTVTDLLVMGAGTLAPALTISYAVLGPVLGLAGLTLRRLGQEHWIWPLYLVAALDLAGTYVAGLVLGGPLAVGLSAAMAVLLLSFAWLERAEFAERKLPPLLTYLGLAALFVGHLYLPHMAVARPKGVWPSITAGLCALFVVAAWLLRNGPLAKLYAKPLRLAGLVLMAIPLLASVAILLLEEEAVLLSVTFAIAGLTYGADGALRRRLWLAYLGIGALVVVIWGGLMALKVTEPQAYVFPAGLTLLGIGWHERRQGRSLSYQGCMVVGLVVLMGSAFVQSLGRGHWPYALLLLAESLGAIGWGVRMHLHRCVQVGGLALLGNGIAQLGPAFVELSGWIQLALVGTVLLSTGIVALVKREEILATRQRLAQEWRQWQP